ncbi:protein LURP-one-related 7 isoform X1 [Senna tora]|uniref:Protein LURP-one-related 7 isoform X1 n=1 Tax=Senna tora TaxID=362788 RepID=A0A834T8Q3_9FABA|nr:protein LURP-one-related 7 isoform X1 [Senna tora]
MESEAAEFPYPVVGGDLRISYDLFGSKKHLGVTRGDLAFADSSDAIVFRVKRYSPKSSPPNKKVLLDAATGNALLSIHRDHDGFWECYKGDSNEDKDLVFTVHRSRKTFTRVELQVFLVGETSEGSTSNFRVTGCPFQRSCKIFRGNDVLAQTCLMYKLNQTFVSRSKFRLTIFPGFSNQALIVALVVIFLNGRK